MRQFTPSEDVTYGLPGSGTGSQAPAISILADRAHLRDQIVDDVRTAGLNVVSAGGLAGFADGGVLPLGDIVLVDCPRADAAALAALARLDLRAGECGARLVVSTTMEALDPVFACMDMSGPQLLVDPTRAERVIALGHALANLPTGHLRELSEDDRLMIIRLTEQIGHIAQRLDRLEPPSAGSEATQAFRFAAPGRDFSGKDEEGDRLVRAARPALPDPRLVRRIIRQRQLRARFFDGDLFADPAWDMLLDLTAARAEHTRVSVTSLCIASGVPPTTALRWIGQMVEAGLFMRVEDDTDRRRAFIALTDKAADAMARYFVELGKGAGDLP